MANSYVPAPAPADLARDLAADGRRAGGPCGRAERIAEPASGGQTQ